MDTNGVTTEIERIAVEATLSIMRGQGFSYIRVVGVKRREVLAKRHTRRPRQRRHANHQIWRGFIGERQGVGQNKTPLGVRVVHLNAQSFA